MACASSRQWDRDRRVVSSSGHSTSVEATPCCVFFEEHFDPLSTFRAPEIKHWRGFAGDEVEPCGMSGARSWALRCVDLGAR